MNIQIYFQNITRKQINLGGRKEPTANQIWRLAIIKFSSPRVLLFCVWISSWKTSPYIRRNL
ncbi:hypothetical protein Tsubulata_039612 [Turnera subulata]|uniref:Uncharacterized protein n=1 Tax=Turnera subulata TaxID=218843 RepID=A0A9Q0FA19_9ROSI|nr:hypothetical protein Tsubulata_039612 [Turnera subulata]